MISNYPWIIIDDFDWRQKVMLNSKKKGQFVINIYYHLESL